MSRRRDGMKEKKCGCITYDYGPPLRCPKHEAQVVEEDEKALRRLVREQAASLGHDLTRFIEYESRQGKFTSYCTNCGLIAIVYDTPPDVGDQVAGWCLARQCSRSSFVGTDAAPEGDADETN